MKWLLSLLCMFLSLTGKLQAQTFNVDPKKQKEVAAEFREIVAQYKKRDGVTDTAGLVRPKAYLVNPKPGIHRLPQDNMPCLVPDLNATVAIPNGWGDKTEVPFRGKSPRLPNPAKPFKFAPSRPLLIHPEKDTNTK
jgi:hypothetical protein